MLTWEKGLFDLDPPEEREFPNEMNASVQELLIEGMRQRRQSGSAAHRIAELKLPTLIIWGGRDRLIPPDDAQRFHHDIAGSTLVIFDDLGHAPEEEDPDRTVSAVQR